MIQGVDIKTARLLLRLGNERDQLAAELAKKEAQIKALEEANLRGSGCDYCDCDRCLGRKID